ncbi:MerR family transcriptional regulator [Nocardia colli]|uniref:MerR family transcriptional regulator n=1 Tax=Nocardia colli TaxID=2545717 RepID=A0A5N0EFC5_9NOCA|nr:MerR family transcriptional regulator [Nocardia colli]KAA8888092.1 MerR family transcriptional regulator [Nocardia colli]
MTENAAQELVAIGEVGRRFKLSVSTLRYWEERGLITASARRAGVRQFDADQLHRIGLIQLWQELGLLSLDEIAAMLSGDAHGWREVVRDRIDAIEAQRRRLAEGQAQLEHMLVCPNSHPAGRCDFMREVIAQRMAGNPITPRDLEFPA